MFEVANVFLKQLCELIPFYIGIYVIFDFTGALIFGKK